MSASERTRSEFWTPCWQLGNRVIYDEPFEKLRERLHGFQGINIVDEPVGFIGKLRDYQRCGLVAIPPGIQLWRMSRG